MYLVQKGIPPDLMGTQSKENKQGLNAATTTTTTTTTTIIIIIIIWQYLQTEMLCKRKQKRS